SHRGPSSRVPRPNDRCAGRVLPTTYWQRVLRANSHSWMGCLPLAHWYWQRKFVLLADVNGRTSSRVGRERTLQNPVPSLETYRPNEPRADSYCSRGNPRRRGRPWKHRIRGEISPQGRPCGPAWRLPLPGSRGELPTRTDVRRRVRG